MTTQTLRPGLGDIPLVGRALFSHQRTDLESVELIVLVTATLIEPPVQ